MKTLIACSFGLFATAPLLAQCDHWHAGPLPGITDPSEYVGSAVQLGPRLIVPGNFFEVLPNGDPANNIVAWDGVQLAALNSGFNDQVSILKSYNTTAFGQTYYNLIAGGFFTASGGSVMSHIAIWSENATFGFPAPVWSQLGPGLNDAVFSLERFNNLTIAGGQFTATTTGTTLNRVAQWNGSAWQQLGAGLDNSCAALKVYNGALYAGGYFTHAAGVNTGGLARWNGSSWSQVGGTFIGDVYALEVYNGELVMAGAFPGINGSPNIARYNSNTNSYSTLGTGGASDGYVFTLLEEGGNLYVGGSFVHAGGVTVNHLGRWNGSSWSAVRAGADYTVDGLGAFHNDVHVGGQFTTVGSPPVTSPDWARFEETGAPWIARQPFGNEQTCGTNVSFTCTPADGYDNVVFSWTHNGNPAVNGTTATGAIISGATTGTLSIGNISSSDAGNYVCTVANGCGSAASLAATLTVDAGSAPTINTQPAAASSCSGASAHFSVSASGGTLAYQWQIETTPGNYVPLNNSSVALACGGTATSANFNTASVLVLINGCNGSFNVRCVVSNACGATTSNAAVLHTCNLPADVTCNGVVDLSDISILLSNYGRGTTAAQGDLNGDQQIDLSDLAIALASYGLTCP